MLKDRELAKRCDRMRESRGLSARYDPTFTVNSVIYNNLNETQ